MNKFTIILSLLISFIGLGNIKAQEKKHINHNDYSHWKSIMEYKISNDGKFSNFVISPQEGDGYLYVRNLQTKKEDSIPRGYSANFSPNSNFLIFKIKPQYDSLRTAKLRKLKKDKLPKDSLGIWNLENGEIKKYAGIISFKLPKENSDFVAILFEKQNNKKPKADTSNAADTISTNKKKKEGFKLLITNPISGFSKDFRSAKHYSISENGKTIAFIRTTNDSIDSVFVNTFSTKSLKHNVLFSSHGYSENISIDKKGEQIAFTYSADTVKNKSFGLNYTSDFGGKINSLSGEQLNLLPKGMSISTDGKIYFNETGSELYFGLRNKPEEEIKDTLTKDEKVSVDIWNWKDPLLQTQQLKEAEKEKKRSFTAVYFPTENKIIPLANENLKSIRIDKKAKGSLSIAYDDSKYLQEQSWDASFYFDTYLIDRKNGERTKILNKVASETSLSPDQKFVAWYNISDSCWYVYDIAKRENRNITSSLKTNFYYEFNDVPDEAPSYGYAGWTEKGNIVIYDKYDLWQFDPKGKNKPKNLSQGFGRKNNIRLRYVKLDKEEITIAKNMLLVGFNYKTKASGFFVSNGKSEPKSEIWEDMRFNTPIKAKYADVLIWRKQSFTEYPELYASNTNFKNIEKITNTNPQQKEYNWGTVELVSWKTYTGDSMQGMLYKPENFDANKKYPMLVYFYERSSDRLHRHIVPAPIRSVINFTYYTSNEYLIFVPDITYTTGEPGPNAFNCIVSGTEAMVKKYDFIDSKNMALQGQSWGGYQTAYLITQTNMYKAAMAGAPVSNMTSAYGGIRWASGRCRAFQYEETQSRIGGTLWEKHENYILNSPLFFVPKIETPLLIMHNDNDGAVPWYQGIELFNAMRRLQKPVWMLVYNGAPHNLKRRADMKDLTIRMQQYFDHFLKGTPEPVWMKSGVKAIDKGKDFGFELSE